MVSADRREKHSGVNRVRVPAIRRPCGLADENLRSF